jgi:hypothetical protein
VGQFGPFWFIAPVKISEKSGNFTNYKIIARDVAGLSELQVWYFQMYHYEEGCESTDLYICSCL